MRDVPGWFPDELVHAGRENLDEETRAELDEHVRDEHSTFSWLLEAIISRAGFEVSDAEHSDDGMWAKYVLRAT